MNQNCLPPNKPVSLSCVLRV